MKLSGDEFKAKSEMFVDITGVVLLSLTAVLSAVCVYQSGLWSGRETKLYNQASALRGAAALDAGTSNELRLIDVALFIHFVEALHHHDRVAQAFYLDRFRPEARPALEAWLKSEPLKNPRAAKSPFSMPEYKLSSDAAMHQKSEGANSAFADAGEANRHADAFIRLTILFSMVVFFGAMSTKFRHPLNLAAVAVAFAALTYGVVRLLAMPFL